MIRTSSVTGRPARFRRAVAAAAFLVLVIAADAAAGQETGWRATLGFRALAVEDADDWVEIRQEAVRRAGGGRRLRAALVQTRRFGVWDVSLEAGGTLRPHDRVYLTVDGRVTPGAQVLDELRAGTRAAVRLGEVVPSLGYEYRSYGDASVHTGSSRVEWYTGPWLLSWELRVIRSAVETVNLAAIGRVARRLSPDWRAWAGLAAGEEDYRVGRPPAQRLRTLTTRSAFGGAAWTGPAGWSLRVDLSGVESDPRLDRLGASLSVTRRF